MCERGLALCEPRYSGDRDKGRGGSRRVSPRPGGEFGGDSWLSLSPLAGGR
jgi:hypothetical protein